MRAGAVLPSVCCVLVLATAASAIAGPPYLTDDPEPTDYGHFEIYTFNSGMVSRGDTSGETGIDFNYGGAPNLQLTATIPLWERLAAHRAELEQLLGPISQR